MAEKNYSFEIKGLFENMEKLVKEAELGKMEAIQRLEAIKKLANPIFDFSPSDYKRILDKQLPLPVKKGMELYKMMRQLTFLVQPVGKRQGTACSVRRVNYENLTWDEFLELRGTFNAGFIMKAIEQRAKPQFNGLNMLDENQKELYEKIEVYFGGKKKPTLQSLAMNLLSQETDGKDYSERSLYIYLDAVNTYQKKRKEASGFAIFLYTTFDSVAKFNIDNETIRESLKRMDNTFHTTISFKDMLPIIGDSFLKYTTPVNPLTLIAKSYKDLVPKSPILQMSELISSIVPSRYDFNYLSNEEDST